MRRLQFTDHAKEFYNLPYGLDGDVEDPTKPAPSPDRTIRNGILGRNAAAAYNIDPDARRNKIACDVVNGIKKDGYVHDYVDPLTQRAPMASNQILGGRTKREVMKDLVSGEWSP
jgi:hypothetical protein